MVRRGMAWQGEAGQGKGRGMNFNGWNGRGVSGTGWDGLAGGGGGGEWPGRWGEGGGVEFGVGGGWDFITI